MPEASDAIFKAKNDSVKKQLIADFKFRLENFYKNLEGCKAPDFECSMLDGDTLRLNSLKGKVVVINFWFVNCKPCIEELPVLNELADTFKGQNIEFLALSRDSKETLINDFLPKYKFNFRIGYLCENIANTYCVNGWPKTFVIDKKGKVKVVLTSGLSGRTNPLEDKKVLEILLMAINECL